MKNIVVEVNEGGLDKFFGNKILLMCANYFYTGILSGISDTCVLLKDAAIADFHYRHAKCLPIILLKGRHGRWKWK